MRSNSISRPLLFSSLHLDLKSITGALRHCGRVLAINQGKSLHLQLVKHGLCSFVFIANNLMSMYADLKLYDDAHLIFDEMPERNVVSWSASISMHTRAGNPNEALKVFTRMLKNESEEPNSYIFSSALKACAMVGDLEMGKWIHDRVSRKSLLCADIVLVNAVLDMYIKCGSLEEARGVFDGGFLLNSDSWNTMISGYAKDGNMIEAGNLFRRVSERDAVSFNTMIAGFAQKEDTKGLHFVYMMHKQGLKLDRFTFPSALKICSGLKLVILGEQLHSYVVKRGFTFISIVGASLIDMYSNCTRLNEAKRIFDESSDCRGSNYDKLPLLNAMVSAYTINGFNKPALDLISKIYKSGVRLDAFTLSSALKICANLKNTRVGLQVHGLIVTNGYQVHRIVGSTLVNLYSICGNLENSLKLFLMLPHKDLIAWTGLISNCVQQGSSKLAFSLFRDMIYQKIEIDHFVISGVLKACAYIPWVRGGEQVHDFCIKVGFESEMFILTSLIDMYSKCGNIDNGLKLFETVTHKDAISWTGIIVGCGQNGRAKKALELFRKMIESGEKPNEITFIGVLSACRHAGLVEAACNVFYSIREKHGLVPSLEHYCCMVDILSRDGRFDEAKKLVCEMPYEADETVWNSMLGASRIHQNAEFDKISISSSDVSGIVSMSNIYASYGMWDRSAKLRKLMRRVGTKESGRSWLEVVG